jgi:beta-lactamase class A
MTRVPEVGATLGALAESFDGRAAIYARHLDTEEEIAIGEVDRRFPTGSAAKQLLLLALADAVAHGTVDVKERRVVTAQYRDARPGSGVLRFLDAGLAPTLHDAAVLMMIVSDNVATDLVLDALGGPEPVNRAVTHLGVIDAEVTSPTVWAIPPAQFGMATARRLASAWVPLAQPGPVSEFCRRITWRHQHREGFARFVPFSPDLPDFGLESQLRLWSKSGAYPTVSCEAGLFETDRARWVLSVMADEVADWGNGSAASGPTLRAEVSRAVYEAWQ